MAIVMPAAYDRRDDGCATVARAVSPSDECPQGERMIILHVANVSLVILVREQSML